MTCSFTIFTRSRRTRKMLPIMDAASVSVIESTVGFFMGASIDGIWTLVNSFTYLLLLLILYYHLIISFYQSHLPGVAMPEAMHQHGCQLFEQVARLGLEGIMAKH